MYLQQDWTACRLNMKPSEEIDQCVEVMVYPRQYGQNFPYDFNIDVANIKWGPLAVCGKAHVYSIFWMRDAKICELYLSFDSKSTYDSYVTYLENLLSSLAKCQIGKFSAKSFRFEFSISYHFLFTEERFASENETSFQLSSTCNYGENEFYESMNFHMEEMDDDAVVPNAGMKILRPISILTNFFTAKRKKSLNEKTKPTNDHKEKSFVTKLFKKKKNLMRNLFSRNSSSQSKEDNLERFSDLQIFDAIVEETKLISDFENNLFEANSLSTSASFHSIVSSHDNCCQLRSENSHINRFDADINENHIYDIEADFRMMSIDKSKLSKVIVENVDAKNQPIFIFDKHEDTQLLSDSSLTSFVTAIDDTDENNNFRFNLIRTSLRRKLSFDDRSSSVSSSECDDKELSKYLLCNDTSYFDEFVTISSESFDSIGLTDSYGKEIDKISLSKTDNNNSNISLLSIATACVKKRICTPYRFKNKWTNRLKLFECNTSSDCLNMPDKLSDSTANYFQRETKHDMLTAETKSPSIPKRAFHQISRIKTMATSLASSSPRAMSIFV